MLVLVLLQEERAWRTLFYKWRVQGVTQLWRHPYHFINNNKYQTFRLQIALQYFSSTGICKLLCAVIPGSDFDPSYCMVGQSQLVLLTEKSFDVSQRISTSTCSTWNREVAYPRKQSNHYWISLTNRNYYWVYVPLIKYKISHKRAA